MLLVFRAASSPFLRTQAKGYGCFYARAASKVSGTVREVPWYPYAGVQVGIWSAKLFTFLTLHLPV